MVPSDDITTYVIQCTGSKGGLRSVFLCTFQFCMAQAFEYRYLIVYIGLLVDFTQVEVEEQNAYSLQHASMTDRREASRKATGSVTRLGADYVSKEKVEYVEKEEGIVTCSEDQNGRVSIVPTS